MQVLANGSFWGRGVSDDKGGLLQAVHVRASFSGSVDYTCQAPTVGKTCVKDPSPLKLHLLDLHFNTTSHGCVTILETSCSRRL